MHSLAALGWTPERADQLAALDRPDLIPARVAGAHRGRLDLLAATSSANEARAAVATTPGLALVAGTLAGRLRHGAASPADLPAVGDWVAADPGGGVVHAVLPRRGGIARAAPDGRSEPQLLAANVDVALVLGSLNRDLNVRRLERMLTLAADARAEAVVVLSKADLAEDAAGQATDVRLALGATVPVVAVSVHAGTGLEALTAWLRRGATAVLLGSSGVGKTTLLNALAGGDRATLPIRAGDDRGRHATTARELVPLPSGAVVIDTPGLRLPRIWEQAAGLEAAFADIAALARRCRFADCRHAGEPGCAVAGAVPPERLAGFAKLTRERDRIERRRQAKILSKALRRRLREKGR